MVGISDTHSDDLLSQKTWRPALEAWYGVTFWPWNLSELVCDFGYIGPQLRISCTGTRSCGWPSTSELTPTAASTRLMGTYKTSFLLACDRANAWLWHCSHEWVWVLQNDHSQHGTDNTLTCDSYFGLGYTRTTLKTASNGKCDSHFDLLTLIWVGQGTKAPLAPILNLKDSSQSEIQQRQLGLHRQKKKCELLHDGCSAVFVRPSQS